MKKLYLILNIGFALLVITNRVNSQSGKEISFYTAQWNVENLFDEKDDPEKDDSEFLPESDKFWTEGKLDRKLNNLAKVINYMNNGSGPDLLAVEEVENLAVMKSLAYRLKDRDFVAAHRESPDTRGIDVGLLYDRNVFDIENIDAVKVIIPTGTPTRDILHVTLIHKSTKERFHIFVNHWPSRRGGEKKSEMNRDAAARILREQIDKLNEKSPAANIIILGDFNDEPTNDSFNKVLGSTDFECGEKSGEGVVLNLAYKKTIAGEGSYLFGGQWDMIDQIAISPSLNDGKKWEYSCDSFEIIKPAFMIIQSGNRKGGALPTYMGSLYTEGFSDHFPIGAKFYFKN